MLSLEIRLPGAVVVMDSVLVEPNEVRLPGAGAVMVVDSGLVEFFLEIPPLSCGTDFLGLGLVPAPPLCLHVFLHFFIHFFLNVLRTFDFLL